MDFQIIGQLVLATVLGALIGAEREYKRKGAGIRTYSLVALGSCLFAIIPLELFNLLGLNSTANFDPTRIIQAIATGIGFIGAGVIFRQKSGTMGLTTAAALWITSAIGVSVGFNLYILAIFTTLLSLFVLIIFRFLKAKIYKY